MRTGRRTAHPRASTWMVMSVRNGRRKAAPPTLRPAAMVTASAMAMVAIGPPSRQHDVHCGGRYVSSFSFGTDAYAADIVGMPMAPCPAARSTRPISTPAVVVTVAVMARRTERAEDRQQDPGRDDRATAETVGDEAHHRIDEDHRDAGGGEQPAGASRGEPRPCDEVERDEELSRVEHPVGEELGHGGVHEQAALEEPQIDEGQRACASRVQDEADQESGPDGDSSEAGAAAVRRLFEAVEERDEAGRDEQKPRDVEGAALGRARVRRQEARGQGDCKDADREVHVEEPRPGRVLEDGAGDDGSEGRRDQDGHDCVAEGPRDPLAGRRGPS